MRTQRPPQHGGMRWSSLLLGIGGALIFVLVLVGCLSGVALLAGSSLLATRTPAPAASPTGTTSQPTATPTTDATTLDWHTYSFPSQGFRVDITTVLYPQHAVLINDGAGQSTDWIYRGAALGSPLRDAAAETVVRVQYTTAITDTNICPAGGTVVTLGSGIHAYQEAGVVPSPSDPAVSLPYVLVSLVTGGVAIRIELHGQGDSDTFFTRYGPIWQHMLASFETFPPLQPLTTHPCT